MPLTDIMQVMENNSADSILPFLTVRSQSWMNRFFSCR